MTPKFALLLASPLVLLGAVAGSGIAVVDVRDAEHHIVLPVPLALADLALALAPSEMERVEAPAEIDRYMPAAERVLELLADCDDAELVRVESPGEQVSIRLEQGRLLVEVDGAEERVRLRLPLEALEGVLAAHHSGGFDSRSLLRALRRGSAGRMLEVQDGDQQVKLWVL